MWPYPWTHVGTPSHLGHMDRVAATMPSQAHAGAAQEAPDIGQWEGQDVPLVRPSSCNVKGGIPSSRRYLPTYLPFVISMAATAPAVANEQTLRELHTAGLLDPSLWQLPCKDETRQRWEVAQEEWYQWVEEVRYEFMAPALAEPETSVPVFDLRGFLLPPRKPQNHQRAPDSNRFADGLHCPMKDPVKTANAFYDADYHTDSRVLAFCVALPETAVDMSLESSSIFLMCVDTVAKVYELRCQGVTLSPLHIVPIYVYTYELAGDCDQIYGAMNRAMRNHDEGAVTFWRPLIWHLDCALAVLPDFKGKLFRGINVRFSEEVYQTGKTVTWPAFSSASAMQSVAEEFVKGDDGSLFFVQSASAKEISRFSKFPDEVEVLFRPNSTFTITSTLYGTSDIGQFYACVDNIAMSQTADVGPADKGGPSKQVGIYTSCQPPASDTSQIVVNVPNRFFYPMLTSLANTRELLVDDVTVECGQQPTFAQVMMIPNPGISPPSPPKCQGIDATRCPSPAVASDVPQSRSQLSCLLPLHPSPQTLRKSSSELQVAESPQSITQWPSLLELDAEPQSPVKS